MVYCNAIDYDTMSDWEPSDFLGPTHNPYGILTSKLFDHNRERDDVIFDKLRNASKSYELQEIPKDEYLSMDKNCWEPRLENVGKECERLAACISETRQNLERHWSSIEMSRQRWADLRGRGLGRWSLRSKLDLRIALDVQPFDPTLEADGELDYKLYQAEHDLGDADFGCSVVSRDLTIRRRYQDNFDLPICQDARFHLEQLSAYEERLEKEHQAVRLRLLQLQLFESILDEEEREKMEKRQRYETYLERFERHIRDVIHRLQVFLQSLLIPCKTPKFPDGDEPMCMTMPWNILPALVVLWGVCWMFYSSPGYVDQTEIRHSSSSENPGFSSIGKF